MKKVLGILLVLCLLVCAAWAEEVQEEISPVGAWILTKEGDTPARIGGEKLLVLEGGDAVYTKDGQPCAAAWELAGEQLALTLGENVISFSLTEDALVSEDDHVFVRTTDGASCAGVWELDRTYIETRGHDPETFGMAYTLYLAEDGTGLFKGNDMEPAAVTWILLEDGLHVHADGECMRFEVSGDTARTEFASLDCALVFARTGELAGSTAVSDAIVRTTASVNLRAGAGKNNDVLTSVEAGTELPYGGETQADSRGVDWYKVIYNDSEAWVSSAYSQIIE